MGMSVIIFGLNFVFCVDKAVLIIKQRVCEITEFEYGV